MGAIQTGQLFRDWTEDWSKQDGHAALLSFGVSQKAVQNFQREMLGRLKRRARIQMKDLDDVHSSIGLRLYQADVVTL